MLSIFGAFGKRRFYEYPVQIVGIFLLDAVFKPLLETLNLP